MKTIKIACQGAETIDHTYLKEFQGDLKSLSETHFKQLKGEIIETGFAFPINVWTDPEGMRWIVGGHQRLRVIRALEQEGYGIPPIPIVHVQAGSIEEAKRRVLQDVAQYGTIERQGLYEFIETGGFKIGEIIQDFKLPDLDLVDFKNEFYDDTGNGSGGAGGEPKSLSEKFLVPPFSVLDARQGYWQDRKKQWLDLGVKSEAGRGENLLKFSDTVQGTGAIEDSTSIFDPVLCELAYRWFCPPSGIVVDPFSGGSVRGVVASKLQRQYIGIDLREEQIAENRQQAAEICQDPQPVWQQGDSLNLLDYCKGVQADFIFSCPPYADLEVYSQDPRDISNMPYENFLQAYRQIIRSALELLKPDRFAAFVVGEVREKKGGGFYRGLIPDTIKAFEDCGAKFYNEAILVSPAGTLPMRCGRIFKSTRKLGKTHQNLLVFCKGDPRKATETCGEVDLSQIEGFSGGSVEAGIRAGQ